MLSACAAEWLVIEEKAYEEAKNFTDLFIAAGYKKINKNMTRLKWKHYWICKGKKGGESNCGLVFFNDDDNVCHYCGSKNTVEVFLEITTLKKYYANKVTN